MLRCSIIAVLLLSHSLFAGISAISAEDHIGDLQAAAIRKGTAPWGQWGPTAGAYSSWTTHTNRLVPIYSFGLSLESVRGENSVYRQPEKIEKLYGRLPEGTLNPSAQYCDQTDIYRLQQQAVQEGKKRVILVVFDGMDWQTARAAAIHQTGNVAYDEGRGSGLHFQDYRGINSDFAYGVTSPHNAGTECDVNRQRVANPGGVIPGGYDWQRAGDAPWKTGSDPLYIMGKGNEPRHAYSDSAASATSLTCGVKTYNDAICVDWRGELVQPIAQQLQARGFAVGIVTSVPISHATPAAAYANNVHRDDYQDLTRDLVGLASVARRQAVLSGVDVLIGAGWGEQKQEDPPQGDNFVSGNRYLTAADRDQIDADRGGKYVVVSRQEGKNGNQILRTASQAAIDKNRRLLGFFGHPSGHLPYRTADGDYKPTLSVAKEGASFSAAAEAEHYSEADLCENPTLADMTDAALDVLAARSDQFWLLVEAGDVDWANHQNNLDNSIGAVKSGDAAFHAITDWIEHHGGWDDTAVIVTADHGHYLVLEKPEQLVAE